ncbi:hypothetical protein M8C21_024253 [Ambrosia artemisiifolia]|uniref:Uncharacterized protein n=1 Tax=Ambrosia artemisiifolia TaxID=4212 RepID=A0AAD5C649_AMBAR|nr:hypothetical protein M8C21_024253 [Ambrosia artemisiifolia]
MAMMTEGVTASPVLCHSRQRCSEYGLVRLSDILIPVEYDVTEVFNVHRFTCSLPARSLQITMSAMILLISTRSRNWHVWCSEPRISLTLSVAKLAVYIALNQEYCTEH